jgi:alpha-glucosidase
MHTRPVPNTSGGILPANPSAKNELSSAVRLSTMVSHPSPVLTIQSVESSARWARNCNDGQDRHGRTPKPCPRSLRDGSTNVIPVSTDPRLPRPTGASDPPHPSPESAPNGSEAPWWKQAVFYQIYPRSFADSDGDGVGDLAGIRSHLADLAWLGVDALWLSPFFRSPMVDFGYDVSDYCDVDPLFGTLADFDALLEEAHALGLKVIIDWVPNHTSDQHPWFVDAASSRSSHHRDWYVWRDPAADGGPPNNWVAAFDLSAPAWTFDPASGQWYLHLFESAQPDLNWDEPGVVDAMHQVLRFWLDRGVDGFRADVVHCIGKDPELPDNPPDVAAIPHSALNDVPVTHQRLRDIRALVDSYPGDRVVVGEVYLLSTEAIATYYGHDDELHLAFNFPPLYARWQRGPWSGCVTDTARAFDPRGAWPTWVLSNHDNPRHRTRYDQAAAFRGEDPTVTTRRSEARARAAAVLLLTLRGTPFMFQGEELGLLDAIVPAERMVDPGGRDGCRAPIPWNDHDDHGWTGTGDSGPWLPYPPDPGERNHATLRADPSSILHLYRRLITLRHSSVALTLGRLELLELPEGLMGFRRSEADGSEMVVVVNFTDRAVEFDAGPLGPNSQGLTGLQVILASDGAEEGEAFNGRVGADQAVVLGR